MARAINNSGVELNAVVTNDGKTGESFLTIEGRDTGAKQSFTIIDRSDNGVASAIGLNKINLNPNQYIRWQKNDSQNNMFSFNTSFGNNLLCSMTGIGLLFNALF